MGCGRTALGLLYVPYANIYNTHGEDFKINKTLMQGTYLRRSEIVCSAVSASFCIREISAFICSDSLVMVSTV